MNAKMCLVKYHVLILFALVIDTCFALNCRSDSGPKEEELRSIYKSCLKKQDGKNSTSSKNYNEDSWNEPRGYKKSQWDRDDEMNEGDHRMYGRDSEMKNKDSGMSNRDSRFGSRYDDSERDTNYGRGDRNGHDRYGSNDRYSGDERNNRNKDNRYNSDDRNNGYDRNSRDDRYSNNDRAYNRNGGMNYRGSDRDESNYGNDKMHGREDRMSGRNYLGRNDMSMAGSRMGRTDWNNRGDFQMTDEFGSYSGQESAYNAYSSTTQVPRRFRREKRKEMNSGQRSQYNPNHLSKNKSAYDASYRDDDRNTTDSDSNKNTDKKACALHCFLENLEMTGDDGMPDRYLVTHAITKDVRDEDLKDFLQESIEECFQILDNENSEDKCEFSKNLLICLSEKGRANCDDWKDDFQF